jgi:large subunit ribosomal protein L10
MRADKQLFLDEIRQKIATSGSFVVTSYSKLEPNQSWVFRSLLSRQKSSFEVVRKRVFLKALEQEGVVLDLTALAGHIGVLFVEQKNPMPAAKAMIQFSKEAGNLLEVVSGKVEGEMVSGAHILELSALPSMDEMRAMLLSIFTAPMSQILSLLEAKTRGESETTGSKEQNKVKMYARR